MAAILMHALLFTSETEKELADKQVGRPHVGGAFSLSTHENKPFTDKDLLGKWNLIYFGFTNCPDICPEELDKMSAAVNELGASCPPASRHPSPTRRLRQAIRGGRAAHLHLSRPGTGQHHADRAICLRVPPTAGRAVGRLCGDEGGLQGVSGVLLDAAGREGGGRLPGGPLDLLLLYGPGRPVRGRVREGEHGRGRRREGAKGDYGVEGADREDCVNLDCSVLPAMPIIPSHTGRECSLCAFSRLLLGEHLHSPDVACVGRP